MRKLMLALPAVLALCLTAVGMDFKRDVSGAAIDLPLSQHHRNTGGSDGAGLCVYSAGRHAAKWQNLPTAEGVQAWMERHPGGSYPEKLDATLKQYFRERGEPVPAYFQHTGGDEQVLDLLIKTRRMPCMTYAGCDDFYGTNTVIAHMVSGVHLDAGKGAILDNNRPGGFLWMTRKELLDRWRGVDAGGRSLLVRAGVRWIPVGGGWVWGWLAPPPPPAVEAAPAVQFGCDNCSYCGGGCTCEPGKCPSQCWVVGQCKNGRCPIPVRPAQPVLTEPFGPPPTDDHEWGVCSDGRLGWRLKDKPAQTWNQGVVVDRVPSETATYAISDVKCSRAQFIAAILDVGAGPVDDSDKYHLSVVGGDKAEVDAKASKYANRLHVQVYSPDSWVAKDRLRAKVTLQEPAKLGGKVIARGDSVEAVLASVFEVPEPKPEPKPEPQPSPEPAPSPAPLDPTKPAGWLWLVVIGFLVWVFSRKG